MKYFVFIFAADPAILVAAADTKNLPERTPLHQLIKLTSFAEEWCNNHLSLKKATNWVAKFQRNAVRLDHRFDRCGYNGQVTPARSLNNRPNDNDCTDEYCLLRYDQNDALEGIKQITTGFSRWAERYISRCGGQPAKQVDLMARWYDQMCHFAGEDINADQDSSQMNFRIQISPSRAILDHTVMLNKLPTSE